MATLGSGQIEGSPRYATDEEESRLLENDTASSIVFKKDTKETKEWSTTTIEKCTLKRACWTIFDAVCFITGQFYFENGWLTIAILPFFVIFGFVNLYSTAFNFYVMTCPYEDCGYIDIKHKNSSSYFGIEPMNINVYSNFQKFIFTTASISGSLSYFFMIISLNMKHIKSIWKKRKGREARMNGNNAETKNKYVFNPFSVTLDLKPKQLCIFWLTFAINFAVYVGSVVLFFTILYMIINKSDSAKVKFWDCLGLVSQFVSWFCAILSCFIFSKIAYSVSNYCDFDFKKQLEEVDKNEINGIYEKLNTKFELNLVSSCQHNNASYFHVLKDIDQHYVKVMKQSLEEYGSWFAVHWLCYTVTAFLSVSYVIQHIVRDLYGKDSQCKGEKNFMCRLSLAYNFLFSISHCILFLYPCFRAAFVTASRYKIIRLISRAHWTRVPLEQKQAFLQYMELEDCTFKVSIMCATVTFGFNLAYFSIFAGIMTVILKLSL